MLVDEWWNTFISWNSSRVWEQEPRHGPISVRSDLFAFLRLNMRFCGAELRISELLVTPFLFYVYLAFVQEFFYAP